MTAPAPPAVTMPMPAGGAEAEAARGEQRGDDADGQPPAEAHRRTVTSRLLVLLHDVDLAVVVLADDGRVEVAGGLDLAVELLDRLVVGDRGVDVVVGGADDVQGVLVLLGHDDPLRLRRPRPRALPRAAGRASPSEDGTPASRAMRRWGTDRDPAATVQTMASPNLLADCT